MTDSDLPTPFLPHWAELREPDSVGRLEGGELKDVFRVDAGGAAYALRVYQDDVSAEDVASELALVAPFAAALDEAPKAIATVDGEPLAVEGGRVGVLTPFVEGVRLDRGAATQRRAAAKLLARLHEIAAGTQARPRRAPAPYRDLDWRENGWWSWPEVESFLSSHTIAGAPVGADELLRRLHDELEAAPATIAELVALELPSLTIHGDYFPGNLIWRDGRIAGVIDWDECQVDWRALEVANAAVEFSRRDDITSEPALVREFLDVYIAAGGELLDREREAMPRLRRLRLLVETLFELGRACRGAELDYGYLWANLTSMDGVDAGVFGRA